MNRHYPGHVLQMLNRCLLVVLLSKHKTQVNTHRLQRFQEKNGKKIETFSKLEEQSAVYLLLFQTKLKCGMLMRSRSHELGRQT